MYVSLYVYIKSSKLDFNIDFPLNGGFFFLIIYDYILLLELNYRLHFKQKQHSGTAMVFVFRGWLDAAKIACVPHLRSRDEG